MSSDLEDYAIVVGINNYPRWPINKQLEAPVHDAIQFHEWLITKGGLDPNNSKLIVKTQNYSSAVTLMNDRGPVQADIDAVLESLLEDVIAGRKTHAGRRLYIYFAGHGVGSLLSDVALIMANASDTLMESNVSIGMYRTRLVQGAAFQEIIVILDCCRNVAPAGLAPRGPVLAFHRVCNNPDNWALDFAIFGAADGYRAWEHTLPDPNDPSKRRKYGILSYALFAGLEGAAADENGYVTAASLTSYLNREVPNMARAVNTSQEPDISCPRKVASLVFAETGSPFYQVDLPVPPEPDKRFVLRDALGTVIGKMDTGQATWQVPLRRGLYMLTDEADAAYEIFYKIRVTPGGTPPYDIVPT